MLLKAILLGLVGVVAVIDSRLIGRQNIGIYEYYHAHDNCSIWTCCR